MASEQSYLKAGEESYLAASARYRSWLEQHLVIDDEDWRMREKRIAESTPFEFLRATFFRWAQWWPDVFPEPQDDPKKKTPQVLGVGDIHAENFGTWRDAEGRLVWGVNDFDECCCLPYTNDLVRLAASAYFAIEEQAIQEEEDVKELPKKDEDTNTKPREEFIKKALPELRNRKSVQEKVDERLKNACQKLLGGYCSGLDVPFERSGKDNQKTSTGRKPYVLAEDHDWLRDVAVNKLREKPEDAEGKTGKDDAGKTDKDAENKTGKDADDDFDKFWKEMKGLESLRGQVPRSAWEALRASMPDPSVPFYLGKRDAGLGSLGRQRFTAVVDDWCGAIMIREAKALAPSAWGWNDAAPDSEILYGEILRHSVRAHDPWISVHLGPTNHNWVVRRLAPDSGKVRLKDLPGDGALDHELWCAMGRELANVHVPLGNVSRNLEKRNDKDKEWLYHAAIKMVERTAADWDAVYRPG